MAVSTTVPTPLTVTMLLEMVAGPLCTAYHNAPDDAELALTEKAGSPYVISGMHA